MAGYPGKQGRKPKASTIMERQRRAGRAPFRESDSERRPRLLSPPRHLDIAAKREWRRMGRRLATAGLVTELDTSALEAYCVAYTRWTDAEAQVRKYGAVVKSPNGFPMPSPYLAIANKAMEQMLRVLGEFGMTPSSRSRLPTKEQDRPVRALVPRRDEHPDPRDLLETQG